MASHKRARVDDGESHDADSASKPRLTRACAECKRHKIKCLVQPGQTDCNKCLRSGIRCVPHNFAQKFIDDDAKWKAEATATMDGLRDAVEQLRRSMGHKVESETLMSRISTEHGQPSAPSPPPTNPSPSSNFVPEGPSAGLDDSDLVPLAMNNLYSLTDPDKSRLMRVDPDDVNGPDLVSQGVISEGEAEFLFGHYRDHINPLLWDGMLCAHKTLAEARRSSAFFVAVVLTVAALHVPNRERALHATYGAFVRIMRGSCLLRCQSLDVVRGLCVGAFFLTSLSWALCSRAVRVATEMGLHKASPVPRSSTNNNLADSRERVRLWYALYVCDHQFALAYGRPPMMHEDAAIRNAEQLLACSGPPSAGDRGLVAQVRLFRILASGYFLHGCDPDLELAGRDLARLKEFDVSVDQWRLEEAGTTTTPSGTSSSLTPGATALYYHLARFQLNSVALRGISAGRGPAAADVMSWDRLEASNIAITAAMGTARLIVDDGDLQRALIGLPIFAHAMIAVCASFLLKMAVVFGRPPEEDHDYDNRSRLRLPRDLAAHGLNFHTHTALTSVERLVDVLGRVADRASQRHVARQVVTGLKELLQQFSAAGDGYVYSLPRKGRETDLAAQPTGNWRQPSGATEYVSDTLIDGVEQDPFDLTGDLDWRFDEGFMLGIGDADPEMGFL